MSVNITKLEGSKIKLDFKVEKEKFNGIIGCPPLVGFMENYDMMLKITIEVNLF